MEQKPAAIINFNSDTAYFIGVLQGDGNINKSFNKKGWLMTYGIRVAVLNMEFINYATVYTFF